MVVESSQRRQGELDVKDRQTKAWSKISRIFAAANEFQKFGSIFDCFSSAAKISADPDTRRYIVYRNSVKKTFFVTRLVDCKKNRFSVSNN